MTSELTLTLPVETIRFIEAKIASGEYSTPSDVISESLTRLEDELVFDDELRHEILARSAEATLHPENLLTTEQMRRALKEDLETLRVQE